MKKLALVFGLVVLASPALAQEFYIVQDTSTKKCTIVDKKPTVTSMTVASPPAPSTTLVRKPRPE